MNIDVISELQNYAKNYKQNTGKNLWLGHNTNHCICGKSIKLIYFPSRNKAIPVELDYNYDHHEFEKAKLHICEEIPVFKCKNCQDKGYTLFNFDRTGQDADIHRIPCKCGAKKYD